MRVPLSTLSRLLVSLALLLPLCAVPSSAAGRSPSRAPAATAVRQTPFLELVGQVGGATYAVTLLGSYAYAGVGPRLVIVDISSPNNPLMIGQTAPLPALVKGVCLSGDYAYVVAGAAGLWIVDVSDPRVPRVAGSYDTPGNASGVFAVGMLAFVADGWAGLRVIDCSHPEAPAELGVFACSAAAAVLVDGTLAFVADGDAGLRIVNILDPAHPALLGSCDTPGLAWGVDVAGNHAYVADGSAGLRVIDVSSPVTAHEVGRCFTTGQARGGSVADGTAYVADDGSGLCAIDVRAPASPQEIGACALPGSAWAVSASEGRACVAAEGGCLRVFDISIPAHPSEVGAWETAGDARGISVAGSRAYVAAGPLGLRALDVADLGRPNELGACRLAGTARSAFVANNLAYVAADDGGLRIVDVSDPRQPAELGACRLQGWARDVQVSGGYAYVASAWMGLRVAQVSNPRQPHEFGGGTSTPGTAEGIYVAGNYAYVADGGAGLRIINIASPAAPYEVGACDMPGYAYDVFVAGGYAYVADAWMGLRVVDISRPAAPREVGACEGLGQAIGVYVFGRYAYVAGGWAGLRVVDISTPGAPREVFGVDTPGDATAVCVEGNAVYVADGLGGVLIFWLTTSSSVTIPAAGGSLASIADGTSYSFPAGAFASPAIVVHLPSYPGSISAPSDLIGAGRFFQVGAMDADNGQPMQPAKPCTLQVLYSDAERGAAIESTLALYYWDADHWLREPTSRVDQSAHTVSATSSRLGRWALFGGGNHVQLPLAMKSEPNVDLWIDGMEVTQGVQTLANDVPLVASRPTMLRVYAQASGQGPVNGLYMSVAGWRDGVPLPGSPLVKGPWAVFGSYSQGSFTTSYNFMLPADWLSGQVRLVATVDATGVVSEPDESNNSATLQLDYRPQSALDVRIVPINYTDAPSGHRFPGPMIDGISDWLMRSYPISAVQITFRAPIDFTGDLSHGEEWNRLLNYVTSVKRADGAPSSQVYYGLIPTTNSAGEGYSPAWGGMAWVSLRAGIGLFYPLSFDMTGELAAHEIGHTLGRYHAPCGGPSGVDPGYPYAEGSVGQYGFDLSRMRIWAPGAPDYAKDLMSYCRPRWVSDYTYRALFEDQQVHGSWSLGGTVEGLFVRVAFDGSGKPALLPVYMLSDVPTEAPRASDYAVELVDQQGVAMASYPVQVVQAEDGDPDVRAIYAMIPVPRQPVARLRLMQSGRPVAERALDRPEAAVAGGAALQQTADAILLRWGEPMVPALVRYTADGGRTWTTVGLDVLGGGLRVDAQALPGGSGRFEIRLGDNAKPAVRGAALASPLPDAEPLAWINGPDAAKLGQPVLLAGHGADREDGALTDLRWIVDGEEVKAGETLQLDGLTTGEHVIILAVRDTAGQPARAEHRLVVGGE